MTFHRALPPLLGLAVLLAGAAGAQEPPRDPLPAAANPDTLSRAHLLAHWARSYVPGRSGDVLFVTEPGTYYTDGDPDFVFMHGSPWAYDARVPVILSGAPWIGIGIRGGEASHEDLGATALALLGLPVPPGANGRVLDEALRVRPGPDGEAAPPRILAVVFLDGFRGDYLARFADSLPALGRLRAEGASFPGRASYLPTATAVAHTTFATASTPARHGIVGNRLYDRETGRDAHAFEGVSPRNVLAPTLTDRWLGWTHGRAVVAAQGGTFYPMAALGGRGACVVAGHRPRAAYYDNETGRWATNRACYERPDTLRGLRAAEAWSDAGGTWMGHDVSNPSDFRRSALFARFEGEATRAVLADLELGADDVTDLLLVNWKASDYVGHAYGPESAEMARAAAEVDRQIGLLVEALEQAAGSGGYVLAVTADHGMPPEPNAGTGGWVGAELMAAVDERFDPGGPGIAVHLAESHNQLFLDRERLRELGVDVAAVARFVESRPRIRAAFSEDEVRRAARR